MAAETGFEIDGDLYEVPTIDSFTMDEAQVLYDYSGLTIEDFVEGRDETEEETLEREGRFRNPGFLRSLMHVAYQRGNPTVKPAKVKALIGASTVLAAVAGLAAGDDEEHEQSPPASTTEPEQSSPSGSVISNESSGDASTTASAAQDDPQPSTGIGRSDTSSPESPTTLSVA